MNMQRSAWLRQHIGDHPAALPDQQIRNENHRAHDQQEYLGAGGNKFVINPY